MTHDSDATDTIGRRIARQRKLRGLSQRELATRTGYSLSLVEKVERGVRGVERYSILHTFAHALGVDVSELTGETSRRRKSGEYATIPAIRRVLTAVPPRTSENPPQPYSVLRTLTQAAIADRQQGRYTRFGQHLPGLVEELQRAALAPPQMLGSSVPADRADPTRVNVLLAELLHAGSMFLRRLGYVDLAWISVQQARTAAEGSDDELLFIANDWHRSELYLKTGNPTDALYVAESATSDLEALMTREGASPRSLSLLGTLHLIRSMIAAQESAADGVSDALRQARRASDRNGLDRDDYQTLFGPSNVAVFRVSTAVELGDTKSAITQAKTINVNSIPSRERQVRYLIDVARAYVQAGKPESAIQVLTDARERAPEYLLNHVMSREIVAQLLEQERRSITPGLRTLAKRMGIS